MKKKDWIVLQNGVNYGVYSFCSSRPSLEWCQRSESIISSKFQDIMPRDADTGVLALSSESEFVYGQSPLVSPMWL